MMRSNISVTEYYKKQATLEGLLELQFEGEFDLYEYRRALAYVVGRPLGVGDVARPLCYGDNAMKFFTFLNDFDEEMLPEWRANREKLKAVTERLASE
jgi:hypothetical protein